MKFSATVVALATLASAGVMDKENRFVKWPSTAVNDKVPTIDCAGPARNIALPDENVAAPARELPVQPRGVHLPAGNATLPAGNKTNPVGAPTAPIGRPALPFGGGQTTATLSPFPRPDCEPHSIGFHFVCRPPPVRLQAGVCADVPAPCGLQQPSSYVARLDGAAHSSRCQVVTYPEEGCRGMHVMSDPLTAVAESKCQNAAYFDFTATPVLGVAPQGFKSARLVCV